VRALIGFLAVALIAGTAYLGTRAALGAFSDHYRFSVVIGETGQGIVSGSDVVARGVIVGEVGSIELNADLQAVVELVLEPHYTVPADAVFSVTGKTLLGEKQVVISFDGPFGAPDAIAEGEVVDNPDQVVELQDVLQDLDELLGAIDPQDLAIVIDDGIGAFVGQGDAIARAVDQGARATDVFSRSLDDQIPTLRDLSLVAEALGPVGGDFNRLGAVIDTGALDAVTDNQDRLVRLLDELVAFSDRLDLVLTLTRDDLDRLIIDGDNVTRLLFAYRPELGDLLVGISDYTDTIGNGGLSDPGFVGLGAGFQIILEEDPFTIVCSELPADLASVLPGCADSRRPQPEDLVPGDPGVPPVPDAVPDLPVPLLEVPTGISATPDVPARGGLEAILDGILGGGRL
jgi:virulence factor Mce-like protein